MITQSIYTLKLEIAHSRPGNLYGDTTAYIQLTNISLNTWMSSEALRIAILLKKLASLAASLAFDQQFRLRNFD